MQSVRLICGIHAYNDVYRLPLIIVVCTEGGEGSCACVVACTAVGYHAFLFYLRVWSLMGGHYLYPSYYPGPQEKMNNRDLDKALCDRCVAELEAMRLG